MAQTHIIERLENLTAALQDAHTAIDAFDAEAANARIDDAEGIAGEIRTMLVWSDAGQLMADEFGKGGRAETRMRHPNPELERCIRDLRLNGWDAVAQDLADGWPPGQVIKRLKDLDDDSTVPAEQRITAYLDALGTV